MQHDTDVQRRDRCMWFGEEGHCLVYNLMLPALILAAFGDLAISVAMMALGTEITRTSKSKKRCATVGPCPAFKCWWPIVHHCNRKG